MRALVCSAFGPIETLSVREVPAPRPGPGQVVIDVKASSINFPDVLMPQGLYQVRPPLPFSPGMELAGIVSETGSGVSGIRPGDRVMAVVAWGAFAEKCAADAASVVPMPDAMEFEPAASLVFVHGTALHALQDRAGLEAGETVLVLGAAGGVGLAAVEVGKALGARVLAAASTEEKRALCRRRGADETIDYVSEELRLRVAELTGGRGADVVVDPVGGAATEAAVRASAWRGRVLVVGFASGAIPRVPANLLLLKERALLGVYWGEAVRRDRDRHRRNVDRLMDWFGAGKVAPEITGRVPLADAPSAIARMALRGILGKIVVIPNS